MGGGSARVMLNAFCSLNFCSFYLAFITVPRQHIWAPQPDRWKVDEACL